MNKNNLQGDAKIVQVIDLTDITKKWLFNTHAVNPNGILLATEIEDPELQKMLASNDDISRQSLEKTIRANILTCETKNPVYDWKLSSNQDVMFTQQYSNNSDQPDSTVIARTETKTDTFEFSLNEGVKTNASFKVTSAPVGGYEISGGIELSLSATETITNTVERQWSVEQDVVESPHTDTNVIWLLDRQEGDGTLTLDLYLHGSVIWWNFGEVGGCNFAPIGVVLKDMNVPNLTFIDTDTAILKVDYVVHADAGIESHVYKTITPCSTSR